MTPSSCHQKWTAPVRALLMPRSRSRHNVIQCVKGKKRQMIFDHISFLQGEIRQKFQPMPKCFDNFQCFIQLVPSRPPLLIYFLNFVKNTNADQKMSVKLKSVIQYGTPPGRKNGLIGCRRPENKNSISLRPVWR